MNVCQKLFEPVCLPAALGLTIHDGYISNLHSTEPCSYPQTMAPDSWHAITLTRCHNTTLEAITLHMGGCFGFLLSKGSVSRFLQNRIVPYPGRGPSGPIGDGSKPALLSTLADGIHIADAGVDHVIQGEGTIMECSYLLPFQPIKESHCCVVAILEPSQPEHLHINHLCRAGSENGPSQGWSCPSAAVRRVGRIH